ncbi:MAG: ATP-binding cassette domain-containing protein [Bacilli bacterium]|nr:ATP-binding cassette domain-containing protein [Bacilli bacterium]
MLKVEHVTKYYDDFRAVNDISFEIKEGEIFGLLGVNGAGKTTTFRMIMGLLDKTEGEITLDGKPIDYSVTDKIGFLTEERSLLPSKTVLEQAIYYGVLKGLTPREVEKRLDDYLKEFNIEEYKNKKIKELSKGNQQKIQFIISVLHRPKLLILDEPFSGLDPINVEMFKKVILRLKKEKTIIIFSSHMMEHVEYFCDSLIILVKGNAVLSGKLSQIKEDYRRKNIKVIADLDEDEIKKTKGVVSLEKNKDEYTIRVEDISIVSSVFKKLSKCNNVTKFVVEEPTLHEIFIDKVGEAYDE